jgi:hypothetical protein
MFISGLRTEGVLAFNGRELKRWVRLPAGVHNAQPFRNGMLFNDTQADVVRFVTRENERVFKVPRYADEKLTHRSAEDEKLARQAFARGLCVIDEDTIACGSSPSTISLHDLKPGGGSRIATLTYDVRNAIHGLEVWPFGWRENLPLSHERL